MLFNSVGVYEGNLRYNKSKYLFVCLFYFWCGNVYLNCCVF